MKKSLLDPNCILSLEIFDGFCWIEVTFRFRFIVRVYGLGFGIGLDITNSKKIKKWRTFTWHPLCDLLPEKIINMSYGGFCKKTSQNLATRYKDVWFSTEMS